MFLETTQDCLVAITAADGFCKLIWGAEEKS